MKACRRLFDHGLGFAFLEHFGLLLFLFLLKTGKVVVESPGTAFEVLWWALIFAVEIL